MATFTVGAPTRCPGLNHWHVPITTAGGVSVVLEIAKDQYADREPEELHKAAINRLISAAREAGATTWPQFVATVQGKTYQV
jgi:hypothetical protein